METEAIDFRTEISGSRFQVMNDFSSTAGADVKKVVCGKQRLAGVLTRDLRRSLCLG